MPLQDLGRVIKRLQHRHHGRLDAALAVIGTTLAQWDALRAIESSAGASGHALAASTFQTDQSFGALTRKLVDQRLVDRHAGVGRAFYFTLTDRGRRVLTEGSGVVEGVLQGSLGVLSAAERKTLLALLTKMLSNDGGPRSNRYPTD